MCRKQPITHTSTIPRRENARALPTTTPEKRGRRECRVRAAPAVSRAKNKKAHEVVTTGSPEQPGIPRAMVLTVSFVISPVIGLSCHRHRQVTTCQLDTSVEASGPHDFAVRISTVRQPCYQRPSHPVPNVRDDRDTPLSCGTGWRGL